MYVVVETIIDVFFGLIFRIYLTLFSLSILNISLFMQVVEDLHFVYLVVEYIKGENLFERLESNFTITEKQV